MKVPAQVPVHMHDRNARGSGYSWLPSVPVADDAGAEAVECQLDYIYVTCRGLPEEGLPEEGLPVNEATAGNTPDIQFLSGSKSHVTSISVAVSFCLFRRVAILLGLGA